MQQVDLFWKLERLSDGAVLGGVSDLVGSGRRVLAALLAHLGEVEERRLHLASGYGSMVAYCVSRLSFSEDEAYRRIDVARLARRFPALFPLLADGRVSLSVASLLKPHITADNADALIHLVSGASVQRARELLAGSFPRPDVPGTIRKLPEPHLQHHAASVPSLLPGFAPALPPTSSHAPAERGRSMPAAQTSGPLTAECLIHVAVAGSAGAAPPVEASPSSGSGAIQRATGSRPIEPLAKGRYKVQLTADTELKNKLELARDLMRHAIPSGDLSSIVNRALDCLIAQLMKNRFGASAKRSPERSRAGEPAPERSRAGEPAPERSSRPVPPSSGSASNVSRATRREVLERDGLRCSFRSDEGVQCEARAWLEDDHIHPRARGGDGSATNIRFLCRAHNLWAAESAYGREHVESAIRRNAKGSISRRDMTSRRTNRAGCEPNTSAPSTAFRPR
jgi:hypothetical protein